MREKKIKPHHNFQLTSKYLKILLTVFKKKKGINKKMKY